MKALKRGDFKIAGDHFQIAVNEAKEIGNENAELAITTLAGPMSPSVISKRPSSFIS